ncbi:hypothetical protein BST81_25540 [Leptolyngbya sp. 'hensonii']|uniref:DUF3769 domain-containing protein n=1 Tax=Leptolyngbya sp. 'hensonii' TaxID=1922337 RepID=UPI00094FA5CC|nr:DUF3769 domain-containing protein [Leptolyngbya sp. 'hensonii']OLP15574.1 hypothetical protein BST81_25540 [Leptolyngbya sp. 'hensonii']
MPYPVLPPEQPPLIQSIPAESAAQPEAVDSAVPSKQSDSVPGVAHARLLARPTSPQSFPPEGSRNRSTAAQLGQPVSISLTGVAERQVVEVPALTPMPSSNGPGFYGLVQRVRPATKATQRTESRMAGLKELMPISVAQNPAGQVFTAPGSASEQAVPLQVLGSIELNADRQTFDNEKQIFTAEGRVAMRFRGALLKADRLQVNLVNRLAIAEGNVSLTRGEQVLQGDRFEYNFVQGTGTILRARGEVYTKTADSDLAAAPPGGLSRPLGDRITASQPPQRVTNPGGFTGTIGVGRDAPPTQLQGDIRRVRYEADRINFTPTGWVAENVRLTNDPFSPPELEVRADRAEYTQTSPEEGVIETTSPRVVFDQGFSIPLLQSRAVIGGRRRESGLFQIGYDSTDRGGVFIEQTFEPFNSDNLRLSITPQILVERMVSGGNITSPNSYGVRGELTYILGSQTALIGTANLASLDLTQLETKLRASVRLRQLVGTHSLALEYSYRDRLFNGSLGFQEVQSSLGAVITSPVYELGQSGVYINYQAGAQYINADTDRANLLPPNPPNQRVYLGRFQGGVDLIKGFYLWQGESLPATPEEGLKYSPIPLVPYLQLVTGVRGVVSGYTSGDSQQTLTGTVTLLGQFGTFSRPYLDYTAFNIGYSQTAIAGLSPFLFDRAVDTRVLTGGIVQQVYGPVRIGIQTAINLDTGKEISTDYILEYSRRTYGVTLRYNPVLQLGALGLRISDFNWTGGTENFAGSGVRFVENGVLQGR